MRRCYIAGPMTGLKDLNFPVFNAEAARLRSLGLEVVNPVEVNAGHSSSWEDCMRRDISAMLTCDTVALLPGWTASRGAMLEHNIARAVGMQIVLAWLIT